MQISLSSPRTSSRLGRFRIARGFSLIELLVTAAIITIITSIVLVRFNSFDGTILLKNFAYNIATALREAQIYSVSVINTGSGTTSGFRYPYGISFTPGSKSYVFFRYNNASTAVTPRYETGQVSVIRSVTSERSLEILDVCVTSNGAENCNISRLDISFRRPEFTALFYTPEVSASTISSAKILVRSPKNTTNVWIIEVMLLGQIVVYKQP
jgi:prepilin-type N-terminal cleavage/methylation domain-containing protein